MTRRAARLAYRLLTEDSQRFPASRAVKRDVRRPGVTFEATEVEPEQTTYPC